MKITDKFGRIRRPISETVATEARKPSMILYSAADITSNTITILIVYNEK